MLGGFGQGGKRVGARAFTLIEIVVVVVIVALLMALLVPALGRARASGKNAGCSGQLRGLDLAVQTYLAKYDNTFPINGLLFPRGDVPSVYVDNVKFASTAVYDPQHWRPEFGALWAELGGMRLRGGPPFATLSGEAAKALVCPSDGLVREQASSLTIVETGETSSVRIGPEGKGYWSYSVNGVLNSLSKVRDHLGRPQGWTDPLRATTILTPSNFIYFVEEDGSSLFNDEAFEAPAFSGDRLTKRHKDGGNVAFGDGHVEWFGQGMFNQRATKSVKPVMLQTTTMFFPDGGRFLR